MKSPNRSQRAKWLGFIFLAFAALCAAIFALVMSPCYQPRDIDLKAAYLTFVGLAIVGLIAIAGQSFLKAIEWSTDEPKAPSAPAAPTQGSQENRDAE